jgi:hypothetical protein
MEHELDTIDDALSNTNQVNITMIYTTSFHVENLYFLPGCGQYDC